MREDVRDWDRDLVKTIFHKQDAEEVLKIRIPTRPTDDFIAWHFEKKWYFLSSECLQACPQGFHTATKSGEYQQLNGWREKGMEASLEYPGSSKDKKFCVEASNRGSGYHAE